MSVLIKNITHYADGDSIGIDCWISYRGEIFEGEPPLITIDNSMGNGTNGEWFFGWKDKGGRIIEDKEFKEYVVKGIEEYIKTENTTLVKIRESLNDTNFN